MAEHQEVEHCERERPEYRVITFFFFFFFFFKYCADVENCGSFRGFDFIYIYIYIDDNMICFNYYFQLKWYIF